MSRFVRLALPLFVVLTGCSFTADFNNFSFEWVSLVIRFINLLTQMACHKFDQNLTYQARFP